MAALSNTEREDMVLVMLPAVRGLARKVAYKIPRGAVDVDDLQQEAMVGVCKALDRYTPYRGSSWATYAYLRAHGAIQDYLRRITFGGRKHWREFTLISLEAPIEGEDLTVGDTIDSGELSLYDRPDPRAIERLEAGLRDLLSIDQRTAVVMHYFEDRSLKEIGVAMGVSESMVSVWLTQARHELEAANLRSTLGV